MDRLLLKELEALPGTAPLVTIGAGITSSHLGDERNLREFLIAGEVAEQMRAAGQNTLLLLIDDCLDPLQFRQLRVGVRKDPDDIEAFRSHCGRPLCDVPDPYECHSSYAQHFQSAILQRLRSLEVYPQLVDSALAYRRGLYAPYLNIVLERADEICAFLRATFDGYALSHLFRVVCPGCGYMDDMEIRSAKVDEIAYRCNRCGRERAEAPSMLRIKLNWKLDCAARWNIYRIDAEPFAKAYLDPNRGSYHVSAALSRAFFGGKVAVPIRYGHVQIEHTYSYQLLEMLPARLIRELFLRDHTADLQINRENIIAAARTYTLPDGLSYFDFVRQVLPLRCLESPIYRPEAETRLLTQATCFSDIMLGCAPRLSLPTLETLAEVDPAVRLQCDRLLGMAMGLRNKGECGYDAFKERVTGHVNELGADRRAVTGGLRRLLGQEKGLPLSRLLYNAPLDLLHSLHSLLHLDAERAIVVDTIGPARLAAIH